MNTRLSKRPVAQQLIFATIGALVLVFGLMTVVAERRTNEVAIRTAVHNLEHEARLMAASLDGVFDAVKMRGERQSAFFLKYLGGRIELGAGTQRSGDADLPVVKAGAEVFNGNERLLRNFRELTGDDAAVLVVHGGRVVRLATLLKDRSGNSMNGVPLPEGDPVARAVLAGQDYQGLAIREGKYNFSTVRVLKGDDGRVWGAYSVRIGLSPTSTRIPSCITAMR